MGKTLQGHTSLPPRKSVRLPFHAAEGRMRGMQKWWALLCTRATQEKGLIRVLNSNILYPPCLPLLCFTWKPQRDAREHYGTPSRPLSLKRTV